MMNFLSSLRQAVLRLMSPVQHRTQIWKCDPSSITFHLASDQPEITSPETATALQEAVRHLRDRLQTVVFPTETVYGLGASALDASASAKIFTTKGRPPDNPLIVHVSSFKMLAALLPPDYKPSKSYQILMEKFWPGALTLLFPRNPDTVPAIVTASQRTVAVRMPSHPVARALISMANLPLAAPSANTSGKPSPTRAEHVARDLNDKVDIILDGGPCDVGLESTVVDGLDDDGHLRILRPGGITVEDIERVLHSEMLDTDRVPKVLVHRRDYQDEVIEHAPTTPGMKYRHYSPAVPVTLLCTTPQPSDSETTIPIEQFLESLRNESTKPLRIGVLAPVDSPLWNHLAMTKGLEWHSYVLGPMTEPAITAQRLFDGLLTLEQEGVDQILVEEVKEEREGLAVMNRVRKAAGETRWVSLQPTI